MYQYLSKRITNYVITCNLAEEKYRPLYEYGFEGVISIAFNTLLVLCTGILLNMEIEMLVYMAFYVILRRKAGGAHRNLHWKCITTYLLITVISIKIMKLMINSLQGYSTMAIVWLICLIISGMFVFILAPVDSKNKRLEAIQRKKLKRESRIVIIVEILIILLFIAFKKSPIIINSAIAGVFVESILLLPIFNRDRSNITRIE